MTTHHTHASAPALAAQHTAGPWAVEKAHDGQLFIHRRDSGYKSLIAFASGKTYIAYTASTDSLGHGGREQANAHLIAAAPELLAALEHLVFLRDATTAATARRWAEGIVAARRAIAKAKGTP